MKQFLRIFAVLSLVATLATLVPSAYATDPMLGICSSNGCPNGGKAPYAAIASQPLQDSAGATLLAFSSTASATDWITDTNGVASATLSNTLASGTTIVSSAKTAANAGTGIQVQTNDASNSKQNIIQIDAGTSNQQVKFGNGTYGTYATFGSAGGIQVASPTGGDIGTGTVNVQLGLYENGVIVPKYMYINSAKADNCGGTSAANTPLWTAPNDSTTWKVKAASWRFTTASNAGTGTIEVAGAAVAPGSGVAQQTVASSLAGTANTTVNGTISGTPTTIAAGSALNIVTGGTMTSVAGCVVTVVLQRIS